MSSDALTVEVVLRDGPVRMDWHDGSSIENSEPLWSGMHGKEHRPATRNDAFYWLTVSKPVASADEVASAEAQAIEALTFLAHAWVFSGGGYLPLTERTTEIRDAYASNTDDVRRKLLARHGRRPVTQSITVSAEHLISYSAAPLSCAVNIARLCHADPRLANLLRYHYSAWFSYFRRSRKDRGPWYVDLYKVRETLQGWHGGAKEARRILEVSKSTWSDFGSALNNGDLRHASLAASPIQKLTREDVHDLIQTSREWIQTHLSVIGAAVRS